MEQTLIWIAVIALTVCSDAYPSGSSASAFDPKMQFDLFQDDFEVGRETLWEERNGGSSVLREPKTEYEKGFGVLYPFDQHLSFFDAAKNEARNTFLASNAENGINSSTGEVRAPSSKRKRKSMAVLNFKKFKFPNRAKRRHFDHENKQKTLLQDQQTKSQQQQELMEHLQTFVDETSTTKSLLANATPDNAEVQRTIFKEVNHKAEPIPYLTTTLSSSLPFVSKASNTTVIGETNLEARTKLSVLKNATNHVDLTTLERELVHTKKNNNHDLLLAISILQHHVNPEQLKEYGENSQKKSDGLSNKEFKEEYSKPLENSDKMADYKLFHDRVIYFKKSVKTPAPFTLKVEINDAFSPPKDISEEMNESIAENGSLPRQSIHQRSTHHFKTKSKPGFHWFVLVMDGDCTIIRHRMSSFVTFLKAALSAKLDAHYEDIYVPSVFCHKTFMVNISIDLVKYPGAEQKLKALAEANTTLLELSGEIFYLEKILQGKSLKRAESMTYLDRNDDIKIVIYFAVGCMCIFILLSVVIVSLIKVCRQDDAVFVHEKDELPRKPDIPTRRPNVIYSQNFTQSLNPDKYCLNHEESSTTTTVVSGNEISASSSAPSSSRPLDAYLRNGGEKSHKDVILGEASVERKISSIPSSISKLCLLEEVQEEDEEDIDEDDYREENDANDDDEDDANGDEEDEDVDDDEDEEDMDDERIIKLEKRSCSESTEGTTQDMALSPSLYRGIRSLCLSSSDRRASASASNLQTSFENPCYER